MPRVDREGPIHKAIVAYLRAILPPDNIVHHSANEGVRGGVRGALDGKRRKEMGQVAGFPDILVLTYRGALFFEVKAEGGRVDASQKAVHEALQKMGYRVAVVRSVDDVEEALNDWSFPTKAARLG